MKILVVCQFYYPENFVISNICEELVKLGNDVTVLTGKPNYGYGHILKEYKEVTKENINGVKINRVDLIARSKSRLSIIHNYLSFWKNAKKWVKKCEEKFDIVYSMSLSPVTILSAGNLYKKKFHVKHVVHCVDLWPESVLVTHAVRKHSLVYKFLYIWSKKLYQQVGHVLLGSPSYEEYFKHVLKLEPKMTYIPQPSIVETSDIAPYHFTHKTNIVYCGNVGLMQMTELIPLAMRLVKEDDICFHIIGMGPKVEKVMSLTKTLGLEDKIIYYGPMAAKKAAAYLKSADALYVSLADKGYVGKTIPNKLVMYMALGKPIIGVLKGDGEKVLNAAGGGILCNDEIEDVAEAFKKISIMPKEEKEKLGQLNRAYYLEHFSLENVSKKINDILLDELN